MNRKTGKILIVLVIAAAIASLGYFGYSKIKADRQILSLNEVIEAGNKKYQALQKKYAEEKTELNSCMKSKQADDAQKRKLQEEISLLQSKQEDSATQTQTLEKKCLAETGSLEEKIKTLETLAAKAEKSRQDFEGKYKSVQAADHEKSGQIRILESEKKELSSALNQTRQSLDRSLKHNRRLGEIAEELTEKYKKKAGSGAEPFTKLGMVELEQLIQEYVKQIDKEKIIRQ